MTKQIKYITKPETVIKHRDEILAAQRLGCDSETTDLSPIDGDIRTLQLATTPNDCFVFDFKHLDRRDDSLRFLSDIFADTRKVKIFHNGKFDIKFIKHCLGVEDVQNVFDTQHGSNLLTCGDDTIRNSLQHASARLAFKYLAKDEQKSDFARIELTDDQIRYGATDAMILHSLADEQRDALDEADLLRVAYLEFNATEAFADIELAGFFLDQDRWLEQIIPNEKKKEEMAEKLHAHFKAVETQGSFFEGMSDVNIDSPDQVFNALKRLGVPVGDSTIGWKLEPLAKDHKVVADLLEYRKYETALKMFGRDYFKYVNDKTKRVHSDIKQLGTPTGRTTSNSPNIQQIPAEKDYRRCWRPQGDDRRLVIADYSQIELRLMADFSKDPAMCKAFLENQDLHSVTAALVFKKALEACGKGTEERAFGKRLNFGVCYGLGAQRYAIRAGVTVKEAQRQLAAYWAVYSILSEYLTARGKQAVAEREARSFSGRTWRFQFDDTDTGQTSGVERNGRNYCIQATGSDILKRALFLLNNALKPYKTAKIVNVIHDEIVVECDASDAENVKLDLENNMAAAGEEVMTLVPCKVEGQISDEWLK